MDLQMRPRHTAGKTAAPVAVQHQPAGPLRHDPQRPPDTDRHPARCHTGCTVPAQVSLATRCPGSRGRPVNQPPSTSRCTYTRNDSCRLRDDHRPQRPGTDLHQRIGPRHLRGPRREQRVAGLGHRRLDQRPDIGRRGEPQLEPAPLPGTHRQLRPLPRPTHLLQRRLHRHRPGEPDRRHRVGVGVRRQTPGRGRGRPRSAGRRRTATAPAPAAAHSPRPPARPPRPPPARARAGPPPPPGPPRAAPPRTGPSPPATPPPDGPSPPPDAPAPATTPPAAPTSAPPTGSPPPPTPRTRSPAPSTPPTAPTPGSAHHTPPPAPPPELAPRSASTCAPSPVPTMTLIVHLFEHAGEGPSTTEKRCAATHSPYHPPPTRPDPIVHQTCRTCPRRT